MLDISFVVVLDDIGQGHNQTYDRPPHISEYVRPIWKEPTKKY